MKCILTVLLKRCSMRVTVCVSEKRDVCPNESNGTYQKYTVHYKGWKNETVRSTIPVAGDVHSTIFVFSGNKN